MEGNVMETENKAGPPIKIIRLPAVLERVGLKRTAVYDRIKGGEFPKPIKLGRVSGWVESEIQEWLEKQVNERG
jgi:prophage regulatory protein